MQEPVLTLSDQARPLVDRLHATTDVPLWRRLFVPNDRQQLFEDLANTGELAIVPHLASYMVSATEEGEWASAAIERLLVVASGADLVAIDDFSRSASCYAAHGRFDRQWMTDLTAPVVQRAAQDRWRQYPRVLGLVSMHRSGFVREAAVRALVDQHDGHELPSLLLRANDWVPQVRRLAQNALASRLVSGYALHFAAWMPLVLRLHEARRASHEAFVSQVIALIVAPDNAEVLSAALRSPDPRTRRVLFEVALPAAPSDEKLVARAFEDPDGVIRLRAARHVVTRAREFERFVHVMRMDTESGVRCAALVAAEAIGPAIADEIALTLALDLSAGVRAAACRRLKGQGVNLVQLYRTALREQGPRAQAAAALGLGEQGSHSEMDVVLPLVSSSDVRLRRAAIAALARLDGDAHVEEFARALHDPSPGVCRSARHALSRRLHLVDIATIEEVFRTSTWPHCRAHALDLLTERSKWSAVSYALEASGDRDDGLRERGVGLLMGWLWRYNRSFTTPTRFELEAMRQHIGIARASGSVPEQILTELETIANEFDRRGK